MLHVLYLYTRQETSSSWSSFPAGAQQGLSLLACNRVFFPCWCATGSFSTGMQHRVFFPCWCATGSFSTGMQHRVFFPCWCATGSFSTGMQHRVFFPCWCATGSFSTGMQHRVFFPCWCAKGSSFPSGAELGVLSLLVLHKFPTCDGNQNKRAMMALNRSPQYHSTQGEYDIIRGTFLQNYFEIRS